MKKYQLLVVEDLVITLNQDLTTKRTLMALIFTKVL